MFSVIFPGQGSQIVGMAKEFHHNFNYIKDYFFRADEILNKKLSKIILEGPKYELNQTENTQPAIFLVSYSIFKAIEKEVNFDLKKAKFFAGHSLGEYSALCCANSINFEQTIKLLQARGTAMQNAMPSGEGGMIAVLGININELKNLIKSTGSENTCYIANDNSNNQIVMSGKNSMLENFGKILDENSIKFIKLPVSAPFHCPLMNKATEKMRGEIYNVEFKNPDINIVSNVTANEVKNSDDIKKLLIEQIEKPVRWRESINNMINKGINEFIEIGPGKVLSGLVKRIDRNAKVKQINTLKDMETLTND